jgi:hypothetical protein
MDTNTGSTTRRALLGAGATIAAASLAGCLGGFAGGRLSASEEWSFDAATVRSVEVHNAVGSVVVAAADTARVGVRATRRARSQAALGDITVAADVTDGVLVVTATVIADTERFDRESAHSDLEITVPRGTAGPVITAVGSEFGEVTLTDTRGDTLVRTAFGRISASRVDGYLSLRSEAGEITATDVTGLDEVRSGAGDVEVDLLGLRGDVDVGTAVGRVTVGVADDLDLDLLAEADGALNSDLVLADASSGVRRLAGRLNAGGPRLHVSTGLGDVSLRAIRRDA